MRPISLVLISHNGKLLLRKGVDKVKNTNFVRPLGGGIEFQETSKDAAIREVKEEIGGTLINATLCGVIENIFTYNGEAGHEIVFVYTGELADTDLLTQERIPNTDSEGFTDWIPATDVLEKKIQIVPEGILDYISSILS